MRSVRSMRCAVLVIALLMPSVAAADVWDEAYTRGTGAIQVANYGLAVEELQRAIAEAPNEFISEQSKNGWNEYVPYFYLGIAKINLGDLDGALRAWKVSEKQGVVTKDPRYAPQLHGWIARVSSQIQAFSDSGLAGESQKDALAAGVGGSETYGDALRMLRQARDTYDKAGQGLPRLRDEDTASFRRASQLFLEARTLFVAAAEAKNRQPPPQSGPPPVGTPEPRPQSAPPPIGTPEPRPQSGPPPIGTQEPITTTSAEPDSPIPTQDPITTTSTAPSSFPADEQLGWDANIAFNTPEQINLDEHQVIKLLLDLQRPAKELEREINEAGKTATATIKISDTVEARLAGAAFDIRPITPELQAVSADKTTEWLWEVTPKQEGNHRLFLTVNAIIGSGADERKHSIRTFDRTIEVRVPRRRTDRWIVPIAVLVGVVLLLSLLVFALRRRTPPASDDTVPDVNVPAAATTIKTPATARSSGSMRFSQGQVIDERYRIVRLVGQGGMGAVYAAEDREFEGELVALKTILTPDYADKALARFKKEIQLARRVAHPNVCRIFDVGYHVTGGESTIFVSMEYITGVPLKTVIQQKGRLNEGEALAVIRDVAAALDATHAAGLIHRDIKSGNVMLSDKGDRAVLMDFGLACLSNPSEGDRSLTKTGAIIGTPAYMSPEQIEGAPLTAATDIYAFGMVIYEMVTGRLPYEGDTPVSILAKRLRERPRSPAHFVPNLKKEWEQAILTCLEHDPAKRFRLAMDIYRALDRAADAPTLVK